MLTPKLKARFLSNQKRGSTSNTDLLKSKFGTYFEHPAVVVENKPFMRKRYKRCKKLKSLTPALIKGEFNVRANYTAETLNNEDYI